LQGLPRSGPRSSEEGLDLGEGLFTRREIWGVGGQKQKLPSFVLDELLPWMQTGEEDVLDVGLKGVAVAAPSSSFAVPLPSNSFVPFLFSLASCHWSWQLTHEGSPIVLLVAGVSI